MYVHIAMIATTSTQYSHLLQFTNDSKCFISIIVSDVEILIHSVDVICVHQVLRFITGIEDLHGGFD